MCVKRGITPVYELVANEGPVHEPLFVFRCQAGALAASGRGTSKRKAKHNAAQAALHRMLANSTLTEAEQNIVLELRAAAASESIMDTVELATAGMHNLALTNSTVLAVRDDDEENGVNPVGSLQEHCEIYGSFRSFLAPISCVVFYLGQHCFWPQPQIRVCVW